MHIPRLFCMKCNTEMLIYKNGELLEATASWGSYYKVYSDVYECPGCESQIAMPARTALTHNGRAGYNDVKADRKVTFSDNFRTNDE